MYRPYLHSIKTHAQFTSFLQDPFQRGVPARAVLCTPRADQPLCQQVTKTVLPRLPEPEILRNEYLAMYLESENNPVLAKPDGTYCFGTKEPEFAAVSVFIALDSQFRLYRELGMRAPEETLSVFVNDPSVKDNAYFDAANNEIRIGIGSGLLRRGLNKRLALDLGVCHHEFGHYAVFLQTPGRDLPGLEGSALHEAIGDVLGTLVMDYLSKIWYARQRNQAFTLADVLSDQRLIGKYALPPNGLRTLRNRKRTPYDKTGEPHSDGLIAGGAMSDVLVGMASLEENNLEDQIRLFTRISLTALALVPAHKVTFRDMLRAFITAESLETHGKHRELIEMCFGNHGITLSAANWSTNKRAA